MESRHKPIERLIAREGDDVIYYVFYVFKLKFVGYCRFWRLSHSQNEGMSLHIYIFLHIYTKFYTIRYLSESAGSKAQN